MTPALQPTVIRTKAEPDGVSAPEPGRLRAVDLAILITMALLGAGYALAIQSTMDSRFFAAPAGNDVWFEADMPTVADNVLRRWSDQRRNAVHPIVPLIATPASYALRAAGLTDAQRLLVLTALGAAMWSATVFALIRAAAGSSTQAIVFTLLAHATAGALFWLPAVETYTLGSVTLLIPLTAAAWDRARAGECRFVVASALSLAVTTTNWMSGIAAAFSRRRPARALQITVNAFAIVAVCWSAQHLLFPQVPFFVGNTYGSRFLWPETAGGPHSIGRALLVHSVVMPAIEVIPEPKWGQRMSVQHAGVGSSGLLGTAAAVLWLVLLVTGVHGMWKSWRTSSLVPALAVTTLGQCGVYLCYGEETFLYALQIAPLLVVCAAHGPTAGRRWPIVIAAILVALVALNNLVALDSALRFFDGRQPLGPVPR